MASACSSSSTPPAPPATSTFTLHYHRPLADYAGWTVNVSAGANETTVSPAATGDDFGALYALTVKEGATTLSFTLQKGTETDAAGTVSIDVSGSVREAWVFSGSATAVPRKPPAIPSSTQVAVYYTRGDGLYSGWGLHTWGDQVTETNWGAPIQPAGTDADLGAGFLVDLKSGVAGNCPPGSICIIVHKGSEKDPGPDMSFTKAALGNIVFVTSGSAQLTSAPRKPGSIAIDGASAHLLTRDTLAWTSLRDPVTDEILGCVDAKATSFELRYSATADIRATETDVVGGTVIPVTVNSPPRLSPALEAKVPRLTRSCAFTVATADLPKVQDALKGQLVAVARDATGKALKSTLVQTAFALDDLYAYEGPLGLAFATVAGAPTFRLWAPTAQSVKLHVHDAAKVELAGSPVTMTAGAQGLWTTSGPASWYGSYYRYEIQVYHPSSGRIETVLVTDPYSTNLSTNSRYSQVVDLADPALAPPGWSTLAKPALAHPTDIVAYEGHVRDFSALDPTVPAAHRGKFLAFTDQASGGMTHLRTLAQAGLTHFHLLPAFDIATVDEDPASRVDLDSPFAALCARSSTRPRRALHPVRGHDRAAGHGDLRRRLGPAAGHRRLHAQPRLASTGATTRSTSARPRAATPPPPRERPASSSSGRWCRGCPRPGLRVVMDVVYNHTNAAGLADKSVLDKVVPGYYHRLSIDLGIRRELELLLQHRHRAPHDGAAHGGHGGALGARLQGGRLPLRPHGAPHEVEHAGGAGGARRAHPGGRRGGRFRGSTSTARAGTWGRRPRTPAA